MRVVEVLMVRNGLNYGVGTTKVSISISDNELPTQNSDLEYATGLFA